MPERDVKEFLRSRGITPVDEAPQPQASPAAPATVQEPPSQGDSYDPESPEFSYGQAIGRGFMRGVGTLPLDVLRFGDYLSPKLGTLARQIPGVRSAARGLREFVNQPKQDPSKESWTEYLAGGAGEMATGALVPGGWVERGAQTAARSVLERTVGRTITTTRSPWQWVQPPGGGPMIRVRGPAQTTTRTVLPPAATSAIRAAGRAGRAAEPAVIGGVAGAVENPDDPGRGAVTGAIAGPAARLLGRGMQTRSGRWLGRYAVPEALYAAISHATGIPYWSGLGPFILWHTSPLGRPLRWAGDRLVDNTGRIIGVINPAIIGGIAGRTGQAVEEK